MQIIQLNDVYFNVFEFKEYEDEGVKTFEFVLVSRGDKEYHLVKEFLDKNDLTLSNNGDSIEVKVSSWSYTTPARLDGHTEVSFKVTLKVKQDDDPISIQTGLMVESFRSYMAFKALLKILEEKGLLIEGEFNEFYQKYFRELDQQDEMEKYYKRVFNLDFDFKNLEK